MERTLRQIVSPPCCFIHGMGTIGRKITLAQLEEKFPRTDIEMWAQIDNYMSEQDGFMILNCYGKMLAE